MKTVEQLTELFRRQGLRVTPQRQAIFGLLQNEVSHPTVEALFDRARADMPTISLKTVYQTVHDLEALGQISVLDLGTGSLRVDPNVDDEHHHQVCSQCGRVRDVPVEFAGLRLPIRYRRDFTVDAVQVIFRGRCENCSY
ncbi:MAG: Fur family transcriptional regulator [Actinomycetota bacterium]